MVLALRFSVNKDGSYSTAWSAMGHPVLPLPLDKLGFRTFIADAHRNWRIENRFSPPYALVFESKLGEDEAFCNAFKDDIFRLYQKRHPLPPKGDGDDWKRKIEVRRLQLEICISAILSRVLHGVSIGGECLLHGTYVPTDHIAVNRASEFSLGIMVTASTSRKTLSVQPAVPQIRPAMAS